MQLLDDDDLDTGEELPTNALQSWQPKTDKQKSKLRAIWLSSLLTPQLASHALSWSPPLPPACASTCLLLGTCTSHPITHTNKYEQIKSSSLPDDFLEFRSILFPSAFCPSCCVPPPCTVMKYLRLAGFHEFGGCCGNIYPWASVSIIFPVAYASKMASWNGRALGLLMKISTASSLPKLGPHTCRGAPLIWSQLWLRYQVCLPSTGCLVCAAHTVGIGFSYLLQTLQIGTAYLSPSTLISAEVSPCLTLNRLQ